MKLKWVLVRDSGVGAKHSLLEQSAGCSTGVLYTIQENSELSQKVVCSITMHFSDGVLLLLA